MYLRNVCLHVDEVNDTEDTLKRQQCCLETYSINLLTESHRIDLYCFSNIKRYQIGTKVKIKYTCIHKQ